MRKKRIDKRPLVVLSVIALIVISAMFISDKTKPQKMSVILGEIDVGTLASYALVNKNITGPDIDIQVVPVPKNNDMLLAGEADIGTTSLNDFVLIRGKNQSYKIISVYIQVTNYEGVSLSRVMVGKNSTAKTVRDLVGKTIGVYNRNSPEVVAFLSLARDKYGVNISGFNVVSKPTAILPQLLGRGDLDAVIVPALINFNLDAAGYVTAMDIEKEYKGFYGYDLPIAVLAVKSEHMTKNKAVVIGILKSLRDSYQWGLSNLDEIAMQKPENQQAGFKAMSSKYIKLLAPVNDENKGSIMKVWELSKEIGVIQTIPSLGDVVADI